MADDVTLKSELIKAFPELDATEIDEKEKAILASELQFNVTVTEKSGKKSVVLSLSDESKQKLEGLMEEADPAYTTEALVAAIESAANSKDVQNKEPLRDAAFNAPIIKADRPGLLQQASPSEAGGSSLALANLSQLDKMRDIQPGTYTLSTTLSGKAWPQPKADSEEVQPGIDFPIIPNRPIPLNIPAPTPAVPNAELAQHEAALRTLVQSGKVIDANNLNLPADQQKIVDEVFGGIAGVEDLQRRSGLKQDGKIGKDTLLAYFIDKAQRAADAVTGQATSEQTAQVLASATTVKETLAERNGKINVGLTDELEELANTLRTKGTILGTETGLATVATAFSKTAQANQKGNKL